MRRFAPINVHTAALPVGLALALGLAACDASFAPSTESETAFFAVYGYLDTAADTQFVRVSPLRPLLDPASRPTDVRASTTLLESGEDAAWQDSLVRLDDGATGLLFYAPFRAQPGGSYRLEVRRADDRLTQAVTRVPPPASLRVDTLTQTVGGTFVQFVTWTGLERPPSHARLSYRLLEPGASRPETLTVPFNAPAIPAPDGWQFMVSLSQDRATILRQLERDPADSTLVLLDLHMEIEQRSEEWMHVAAPLNIQNGFGFFGAVARFAQTWTLDPAQTVRVGFATPPPGAPAE